MKACNFQTEANIDHLIFVQSLRTQSFKETILQGIALSFLSNSAHKYSDEETSRLALGWHHLNAKSLGGKMFNEKAFKGKGSG